MTGGSGRDALADAEDRKCKAGRRRRPGDEGIERVSLVGSKPDLAAISFEQGQRGWPKAQILGQ